MRIIFIGFAISTLCFVFSLHVEAAAVAVDDKIPEHAENNSFFLSDSNQYILINQETSESIFGKLQRDQSRVVQIPTKSLQSINIVEGGIIQIIDLKRDGVKSEAKITKDSTVLLMPATLGDQQPPFWPKFNLIITTNPDDLKKLEQLLHEKSTGFAYVGKRYILNSGPINKLPTEKLSKNDSFWKYKDVRTVKSGDEILQAKVNGYRIILFRPKGSKSATGYIEYAENKFYFVGDNNSMLSTDGKLMLGQWIPNSFSLFYEDGFGVPGCKKMIVFEHKKISQINFPCRENTSY